MVDSYYKQVLRPISQFHRERKQLRTTYPEQTAFNSDDMHTCLHSLGFNLSAPYVRMKYVKGSKPGTYDLTYYDPHAKDDFGTTTYIQKKDGTHFPKHHYLTDADLRRHFTAWARSHSDNSEAQIKRITESTLALPVRQKSNIVVIDIDNHSTNWISIDEARVVTQKIVESFRNRVVLYETNTVTGSSHIYLKIQHTESEEKLKRFAKQLTAAFLDENSQVVIDIRYRQKKFRLPGSYNYDMFSFAGTPLLTPAALFKEVDKRMRGVNRLRCQSVEQFQREQDAWQQATSTEPAPSTKTDLTRASWMGRVRKVAGTPIKITAGNRVGGTKAQWRLAFYCVSQNMTADQFYEQSLLYNDGSKDLSDPVKARKVCDALYASALKYYKPMVTTSTKKVPFVSNAHLLSPELKKACRRLARQFVQKERKGKWKLHRYKAVLALLWELHGWMLYDAAHPRQLLPNSRMPAEVLRGAAFSQKFLGLLHWHYKLKVNIGALFNELSKCTFLLRQFKHDKQGYSSSPGTSYCRQWFLGTGIDHTAVDELDTLLLQNLTVSLKQGTTSLTLLHSSRSQLFIAALLRFHNPNNELTPSVDSESRGDPPNKNEGRPSDSSTIQLCERATA